jgi:hypothetical protein
VRKNTSEQRPARHRQLFVARTVGLPEHSLIAYFDESGSHSESPILVVAGLISTAKQWRLLSREWNNTLAKYGLDSFHMVDCVHKKPPFDALSKKDNDQLIRDLVRLTRRRCCWRSWTAVVMAAYWRRFPRDADHMPYAIATIGCASRILDLATEREEDVSYVFDQGGKGGYARNVLGRLANIPHRNLYRMGDLSEGRRVKHPPPPGGGPSCLGDAEVLQ